MSDAAGVNLHDWFEKHVGGTEDMDYGQQCAMAHRAGAGRNV